MQLLLQQQVEATVSHWFCLRVLCGPQSSPTRTLCPTPTAQLSPSISSWPRAEEEEEGASTVKVTLTFFLPDLLTPPTTLRSMLALICVSRKSQLYVQHQRRPGLRPD